MSIGVKGQQARIGWLDGLRAVAIGGVLLVHTSQLVPGLAIARLGSLGQYGVQLFFVISALTVFLTLRAHLGRGETIASWYARRFFRIAPLYYAGIMVYFVRNLLVVKLGGVVDPGALSVAGILSNIAFIHAWTPVGNNSVVPGGWSIGVEMSFYAVAPLLFLSLKRVWWPALFIGLGAAMLWLSACQAPFANNSFHYFWFPTQVPVFLCGLGLAGLTGQWLFDDSARPLWSWGAAIAFVVALPIAAELGAWGGRSPLLAPMAFGVSFCALIVLARGPLRGLLGSRPFVWIGGLSYSIYITHFVVIDLTRLFHKRVETLSIPPGLEFLAIFALTAAFSILVSMLSRRIVEAPGIRLGNHVAKAMNNRTLKPGAMP